MLKFFLNTEMEQLSPYMDKRMLSHILHGQVNKFECHKLFNLICFKWYANLDLKVKPAQIVIYFSADELIFLCEGEKCLKQVRQMVSDTSLHEPTLYTFFDELIKDDIDHLEELEERITETEDVLLTTKRECAGEIISFRRELLRLKKYYEQLNQIFEGLTQNENGLIPSDDLRYFRILDKRIDRLFAHVLNLRDYVTQVREAYQAQIDIEQNSLMKIFTVVTAIFLPLTLIVGWYGMNLKIPEYSWKYGYPFVIVLSIAIAAFCIVLFKRRKWF